MGPFMRYKKVLLSGYFFIELFTEGNIIHAECVLGFPKGTKFVYSFTDQYRGIYIIIEHESFSLLEDGDEIPNFETPLIKKL